MSINLVIQLIKEGNKKMKKKLENIKSWWLLIAFFIGLLVAFFMTIHNSINQYNDVIKTIKTTQQMALKSVIWNDNIPLGERASACDVYLNAEFNSLTKKECEIILEQGAEQGIFSYSDNHLIIKNDMSIDTLKFNNALLENMKYKEVYE